jgi:hypothetical protein
LVTRSTLGQTVDHLRHQIVAATANRVLHGLALRGVDLRHRSKSLLSLQQSTRVGDGPEVELLSIMTHRTSPPNSWRAIQIEQAAFGYEVNEKLLAAKATARHATSWASCSPPSAKCRGSLARAGRQDDRQLQAMLVLTVARSRWTK